VKPTEEKQTPIQKTYETMRIGYSVSLNKVFPEKMEYAKSVGIDCIEVGGFAGFFDNNRNFIKTDAEAKGLMSTAKKTADHAGIEIWSIHMPFSKEIDLSTADEGDRQKVVDGHIRLLEYLQILKPKIILFHPSYHIDPPGQRELRKNQLVKSVMELDKAVRAIGATMVVENMLGPELMIGQRERALMRNIEETVELFDRFPATVYSAIDMNHIKNPERLIRAMGKRLKTVHIADGTGEAENHWLPCSGQGKNNWKAILTALHEVGYTGPFMYECAYKDERELTDCYKELVGSL
jgi:hexosaminidase